MTRKKKPHEFMIGQRVIYYNTICTVCMPEGPETIFDLWVYNPAREYKHAVALENVKPLPRGQL